MISYLRGISTYIASGGRLGGGQEQQQEGQEGPVVDVWATDRDARCEIFMHACSDLLISSIRIVPTWVVLFKIWFEAGPSVYVRRDGACMHGVLKPSKPRKNTSTGAVVNFSIFNTAEFRSQIRPIQETPQPWYSKLEISFSNCSDIQPVLSTF